jgi:hypothetical protein
MVCGTGVSGQFIGLAVALETVTRTVSTLAVTSDSLLSIAFGALVEAAVAVVLVDEFSVGVCALRLIAPTLAKTKATLSAMHSLGMNDIDFIFLSIVESCLPRRTHLRGSCDKFNLYMHSDIYRAAAVYLRPVINAPHGVVARTGNDDGAITTRQRCDVPMR